jgi:anthranilate/para-aminobenzoate synthase component I
MGWPTYRGSIDTIQQHLSEGDIYQLNLTLGLTAKLVDEVTIEEVFTRLRDANSGQFGGLFRFDESRAAICLSPERLAVWGEPHPSGSGRLIETAPIKGTRPKSNDPDQDLAERESLLKSEKDQAEHVMILDLERNDLGRICETGSVEVVVDRELRSYTTVHHLVSVVRGQLRSEVGLKEILKAIFPGGSVTGAPKLRAMETIRELEVGPRGIYCGALGYLDPRGGGDLNIPIRTALIHGQHFTYHSGGGIVADSTATGEWEELWVKTRGVQRGLGEPKTPERNSGQSQ